MNKTFIKIKSEPIVKTFVLIIKSFIMLPILLFVIIDFYNFYTFIFLYLKHFCFWFYLFIACFVQYKILIQVFFYDLSVELFSKGRDYFFEQYPFLLNIYCKYLYIQFEFKILFYLIIFFILYILR